MAVVKDIVYGWDIPKTQKFYVQKRWMFYLQKYFKPKYLVIIIPNWIFCIIYLIYRYFVKLISVADISMFINGIGKLCCVLLISNLKPYASGWAGGDTDY